MNAVIYARYSSTAQNEQSIEGQLHDCYDYAKRNEINIVGEYIDRAITGRTDERPDFQRMIADAPKKQFQRVLVWKLDRFARNRYDSAIYKQQLKKCGVRVVSVMENVGEGDESILMEAMLEALAEYYSLDLKKKITRGLRESLAKKQYCGGSVPYGYRVVDRHIVVDPDKAPIIQAVFERYAAGEPMKSIIDDLKTRGVRGRLGGQISYTTFSRSLVNPAYIGKYTYHGQIIEGMCEAIIPQDTFQRVQERVQAMAHHPAQNKAEVDYLLSGKLFCGHCGEPMIGESGTSRHGTVYYYYKCAGRKRKHNCDKKPQHKDALEDYVIQQTLAYVLNPENMQRIADTIVAEYEKEFNTSKIRDCERRISAIDRELNNLVDTLSEAPKAARARILQKMDTLDAEKSGLESDLSKLRITASLRLSRDEVLAWLRSFCSGSPSDDDFRHNLIDAFVNSIYVYDDRIVIFYNLHNTRTTVSHAQLTDTLPTSPPGGSDLIAPSPLTDTKSEPAVIFVNRVFGLIFHRKKG